jgi:hypothetical protein
MRLTMHADTSWGFADASVTDASAITVAGSEPGPPLMATCNQCKRTNTHLEELVDDRFDEVVDRADSIPDLHVSRETTRQENGKGHGNKRSDGYTKRGVGGRPWLGGTDRGLSPGSWCSPAPE